MGGAPCIHTPQRERRQAATLAIVRANENLASEKKGERQDQKTSESASRKRQNELAAKQEAKLQSDQVVVLDGEALPDETTLDKQRMGKCNECRSFHPFGSLEGCLTCGQVLCSKCVKTGQHSACLAYPEVARNTNLARADVATVDNQRTHLEIAVGAANAYMHTSGSYTSS